VARLREHGIRDFSDMDFRGVVFRGHNLTFIKLERCDLSGASFVDANVSEVMVRDANIGDADFSGAKMPNVDLAHTIGWEQARCSSTTEAPLGWVCEDGAFYPAPSIGF
jgi:uncharacterized protein YjbI with pentapeptide repeats